jgi:acyl carrier protein
MDEARLKTVVGAVLGLEPGSVGESTSADSVTGWDSLRHMNLVIALEEAFSVTIPDEDVVGLTSYPVIRAVLREQLGG